MSRSNANPPKPTTPSGTAVPKKGSWTGLYILAVAVFAAITTEMAPVGMMPVVSDSLGIAEHTAGLLVTLYAALVAFGSVPLTLLTYAIGRKQLLLTTMAVFVVSNLVATVAPNFGWLVLARAIGGTAHALFFALSIGYSSRIAPKGQIGRAMAIVAVGGSAGQILGVPAGTLLASLFGWRVTFATLALIMAGAFLAALFYLPKIEHDPVGAPELIPGGGKLMTVVGLNGLVFLGHYTLYTYVSPLLLSSGLASGWLSPVLVVFGLAGLIGIQVTARHLDAHPYRWLVIIPSSLCVGLVLTAVGAGFMWPLLVLATMWVAAFGPVGSVYQSALVRIGKKNPEMAGAWINASSNVGISAGSFLGGMVVTGVGYSATAWVGAALMLLTVGLTLLARKALQPVVDAAEPRTEAVPLFTSSIPALTGAMAVVQSEYRGSEDRDAPSASTPVDSDDSEGLAVVGGSAADATQTGSIQSPGLASLHEAQAFDPAEDTATEVTASEDTWAAPVGLPVITASTPQVSDKDDAPDESDDSDARQAVTTDARQAVTTGARRG
ncbi:MAG: MFS transporter [Galactobacter sp.]